MTLVEHSAGRRGGGGAGARARCQHVGCYRFPLTGGRRHEYIQITSPTHCTSAITPGPRLPRHVYGKLNGDLASSKPQ